MEDPMDIPDIENVVDEKDLAVKTTSVYFTNGKTTGFEKALDYATDVYLMGIILIAWVVVGIVYQAPIKWQIVMEDGQSIQMFCWHSFLTRQQLNHYQSLLRVITQMRSRNITVQRLFCKLVNGKSHKEYTAKIYDGKAGSPISLPARTNIDRLSNRVAKILGSLVVVWLACGTLWTNAGNAPPYTGATTGSNPEYAQLGNDWQMYINTAVAVELLVTSVFLQNIRHRHSDLAEKYLTEIAVLDFKLEHKLRDMTKDIAENEMVKTQYPPRNKMERVIDYSADVIGTCVGASIAGIVFVVWLAIGTLMHWNSNWWLIIGTYTGLAGFFDGFVLRDIYSRIGTHEAEQFSILENEDRDIFAIIGVEVPEERPPNIASRGNRISNWIAGVCSFVALFTLIGLVSVSSALKWTVTGQLISNTPTMVIEGFFLLILIQAANWKDMDMRVELYNIYLRRRTLLDFLETSDVYAY
ncbi:Low-affinity Fe [Lipomyces doorenjongii]|uniref:Low-affinity Fe n=1 Tax=Lipomyces doorenjongii TaxID=383834 RepID=UPI0034CFC4FB